VNNLKDKVGENNIRLNEAVLKIDYSGDQVKVNSKNTKTNHMSEFNGSYCICTIPLGNIH